MAVWGPVTSDSVHGSGTPYCPSPQGDLFDPFRPGPIVKGRGQAWLLLVLWVWEYAAISIGLFTEPGDLIPAKWYVQRRGDTGGVPHTGVFLREQAGLGAPGGGVQSQAISYRNLAVPDLPTPPLMQPR